MLFLAGSLNRFVSKPDCEMLIEQPPAKEQLTGASKAATVAAFVRLTLTA
jgi:hypothetical protein